jgi:hypothetical protein
VAREAVVQRYESLRAGVLARRMGADRQGLSLLISEGMATWSSAWACCVLSAPVPNAAVSTVPCGTPEASALVRLLASMALSTLQESPS